MRAYNHVIELAVEECKSTANPVKILKRITFVINQGGTAIIRPWHFAGAFLMSKNSIGVLILWKNIVLNPLKKNGRKSGTKQSLPD